MSKRVKTILIFLTAGLMVSAFLAAAGHCQQDSTKNKKQIIESIKKARQRQTATKSETKASPGGEAVQKPLDASAGLKPQYQTDISTGRATVSIPLAAAPGRAGIAPNLALSYQSGGPNGWCGLGWDLELGSVVRLGKRKGAPTYDDSKDIFLLTNQGSSEELVSVGSGQYRPKTESGFAKIIYNGAYWTVTDKNGAKYYFGQTDASRQSNSKGVFKWCIDKAIDTNSNYMAITYQKDQGQIYPYQIKYTGNEATGFSPANTVTFVLEARPKIIINSFSASKVVTTQRLLEAQVDVSGAGRVRSYKLTYSDQYYNSLLTKITQYGTDSSSTLPAVTFDYDEKAAQYSSSQDMAGEPDGKYIGSSYLKQIDADGDGLVDLIEGVSAGWKWHRNNGDGSWLDKGSMPGYTSSEGPNSNNVRFLDVDGDGLIDVIEKMSSGWKWHRNNGDGSWIDKGTMPGSPSSEGPNSEYVRFLDVDGDGLIDVIEKMSSGWKWRRNNGDGSWLDKGSMSGYTSSEGPSSDYIRFVDVNGDGLMDVIEGDGGASRWYWYKNNGDGSWGAKTYMGNFYGPPSSIYDYFIDINGDGLIDIIRADTSDDRWFWWRNNGDGTWSDEMYIGQFSCGPNNPYLRFADLDGDGLLDVVWGPDTNWKWWRNKGDGYFEDKGSLGTFTASAGNENLQSIDINGDGLVDIVDGTAGSWYWWKLNGTKPSAPIVKISNGIGAATEISYTRASKYPDCRRISFFMNVVSAVTSSDGMGNSYTTTYEYSKGEYNHPNREFRGFGYVKVADPEGNFTETRFHQDDIYKGRAFRQEVKDKYGDLFTQTESAYSYAQIAAGVNFVYLTAQDAYTYDGDSTYKRAQTTYQYDQYGNPAKVRTEGDTSITGDELDSYIEYNYDTTNWILSKPSHTYVKDYQNAKISEKWLTYDSKGNLTKDEIWLNTSGTKPKSEYTYDSFGRLIKTKDSLGRITQTEYETTYNIYPKKVTNALGHTQTFTYDPKFGAILTSTDPNGQVTTSEYDVFGRLKKAIAPAVSGQSLQTEYSYELTGAPNKIIKTTIAVTGSTTESFTSYTFFDGFGRILQAKSDAEDPARQIISGVTTYDQRGSPKYQYFPYYVDKSAGYTIPDTLKPRTEFVYDCLGRTTRVQNPDASYRRTDYSDWSTTSYDEEGRRKDFFYDAYGRLIKVNEYNNREIYATTYYSYDPSGNLIKVTDSKNNVTTISYDSLNRKIQMTDPDMGIWEYDYDKAGNLIKQTDAKGQVLEFKYDALNRLLSKGKSDGSQPAAQDYTKLLLHCDGSDGSADFIDSSDSAHSITAGGSARIGAAQSKFGGASVLFDGSGDYLSLADNDDWNFGSGDWTIDFWVRFNTLPGPGASYGLYCQAPTTSGGGYFRIYESGGNYYYNFKLYEDASTETVFDMGGIQTTIAANTWYHVALVRSGNNWMIFQDGTQVGRTAVDSAAYPNYGGVLSIGSYLDLASWPLDGRIDEFRISKGIARWTSGFTPPAEPYTAESASGSGSAAVTYLYKDNLLAGDTPPANAIGRLSEVSDRSGSTKFFYDQIGRETTSTKAINGKSYTVQREYDAFNRLITLTYPNNTKIEYAYNKQGNLESVKSGSTYYVSSVDYTATDQISATSWGDTTQTSYTYDPDTLRLTSKKVNNGDILNYSYGFDKTGNIKNITDSKYTATQTFEYDSLSRLTKAAGSYGTENYSYDSIGNILSKEGVSYSYGSSKPHAVTSLSDGSSFSYDANGNLVSSLRAAAGGEAISQRFSYDAENHLNKASKPKKQGDRYTASIRLNPGWNFFSLPLAPDDFSIEQIFKGHQKGADYSQVSRPNPSKAKGFDDFVGNAVFDEFNALEYGKGYQVYINNPDGITLEITGSIPATNPSLRAAEGGEAISQLQLKAGWNLIAAPTIDSIYYKDALNNLQEGIDYDKIREHTGTNNFKSALFLKKGKSYYVHCLKDCAWDIPEYADTNSFAYDGDGGRVQQVTKDDITTYVGSLYEERLDGSSTIHIYFGSTRICSKTSSLRGSEATEAISYYHTDHLGSSSIVTNGKGEVIRRTEYKPFGEIFLNLETNPNSDIPNFFYTGKRLDKDTGLYYYGARYYDPTIGKFTQPDTIVPNPSNPQDFNRYSYCSNNPINYIDPTGHSWFSKNWKTIVGAIGTVVSIFVPPLAPAMWLLNTAISAYTAIETGSIAAFAGGMIGGIVGGGLGAGIAKSFAGALGAMGASPFNFLSGAIIGAGEFGMAGFGSGFGGALASGASFGDSMKAGGTGAAIGAISGAAIQGSYAAGWQDGLHGLGLDAMGLSAGAGALKAENFGGLARIDSGLRSRSNGKMGLWLHGTNEAGYTGINISHSLDENSSVTFPFLRDAGSNNKFAFKLNPQEYASYTGMNLPKGEYLALAVGRADYLGTALGGRAPEYLIAKKNLAVAYKNNNR